MNFSFFLARRFFQSIGRSQQQASKPTITIATAGVAIGLLVMMVSVSIIFGFKREISQKVRGFGSDIEMLDLRAIGTPDAFPIDASTKNLKAIEQLPTVKSAYPIVQKMGILKTNSEFMGLCFKGLPTNYDTAFLSTCLVKGKLPQLSNDGNNDIVISRKQAERLQLKVGDRVFAYFFEQTIKQRRFTIVGIYESHMGLFDDNVVLANRSTIAKLNEWQNDWASEIEVRLNNWTTLDNTKAQLEKQISHIALNDEGSLRALSIKEHYAQIFSWLDLLDFNMVVILVLMVIVSGFTMVSGLFILILERTATIGTLKALGASNGLLQRVFLNFAALITLRGILIGDVIALAFLFVQNRWQIIPLDSSTYYISAVPVEFHWLGFALINIGTLILTLLALLLPSFVVARIDPGKAIRFE